MVANKQALDDVTALARDLIRIPSLTPIRPQLQPEASRSLDYLENILHAAGANCRRLTFEGGHETWGYPVDNLYAEWGDCETCPHICFLGHTDVVPPGDPAGWSADPYSGHIDGGFLCGRGATDMKGAVAAFIAAAIRHVRKSAAAGQPAALSLLLTTDEEWVALNGTRKVLEWMRDAGKRPAAFLVGEPSSSEEFGAAIKVGRRGSLCGTLRAAGIQGHAAYPQLFENPNRALALALTILHQIRWDDGTDIMPATNFETVAMASGDFNATAIIPGEAAALWNIRFTHRETVAGLMANLQDSLENPPDWVKSHADAIVLRKLKLIGNVETASMPYYSHPGAFAQIIVSVVAQLCGRTPILDAGGGTTDGRFIHDYYPQAEIVELGLPEAGGIRRSAQPDEFGKRGGMHQADERCSLRDLECLADCYTEILSAYDGRE